VGGIIWTYNLVVSWLEGPVVQDGDPWNLDRESLRTAEWSWFERKIETAVTDGGEPDEEELVADGGEPDDAHPIDDED
jgi:cytochrome c oxidase subunit 1